MHQTDLKKKKSYQNKHLIQNLYCKFGVRNGDHPQITLQKTKDILIQGRKIDIQARTSFLQPCIIHFQGLICFYYTCGNIQQSITQRHDKHTNTAHSPVFAFSAPCTPVLIETLAALTLRDEEIQQHSKGTLKFHLLDSGFKSTNDLMGLFH